MSDVFKPSHHYTIPPDATFTTKKGIRYAKFRTKNGRLVQGEVLPNGKARIRTEHYYANIKRGGRWVRVPLHVTDRESALALRTKLVLQAERTKAGLDDPRELHLATPLAKHLEFYEAHLKGSGYTAGHVKETITRIKAINFACAFRYIEELCPNRLGRYMDGLIKSGLSRRTRNKALEVMKAFVHWMMAQDRMANNPFKSLSKINQQADPHRRTRRALTPVEIEAIVRAAEAGPKEQQVSGKERALLYMVAVTTGLRSIITCSSGARPPLITRLGYSPMPAVKNQSLRMNSKSNSRLATPLSRIPRITK